MILFVIISTVTSALYALAFSKIPIPPTPALALFFQAEHVINLHDPILCSFVGESSCIKRCSWMQMISWDVFSDDATSSGIFSSFLRV